MSKVQDRMFVEKEVQKFLGGIGKKAEKKCDKSELFDGGIWSLPLCRLIKRVVKDMDEREMLETISHGDKS